jgi:hypothetical protein
VRRAARQDSARQSRDVGGTLPGRASCTGTRWARSSNPRPCVGASARRCILEPGPRSRVFSPIPVCTSPTLRSVLCRPCRSTRIPRGFDFSAIVKAGCSAPVYWAASFNTLGAGLQCYRQCFQCIGSLDPRSGHPPLHAFREGRLRSRNLQPLSRRLRQKSLAAPSEDCGPSKRRVIGRNGDDATQQPPL